MDLYADMLTRAPLDLKIDHDISQVLHYQTPGGTQRGDVTISQKNWKGHLFIEMWTQTSRKHIPINVGPIECHSLYSDLEWPISPW